MKFLNSVIPFLGLRCPVPVNKQSSICPLVLISLVVPYLSFRPGSVNPVVRANVITHLRKVTLNPSSPSFTLTGRAVLTFRLRFGFRGWLEIGRASCRGRGVMAGGV